MTTLANLEATRGDTWAWEFTILQADRSTPQDISGASARFTVKAKTTDADVDAIASVTVGAGITITDAANGVLEVRVPKATTAAVSPGAYAYDLQVTDAGGDPWTPIAGRLDVAADISITQP